MMDVFHEGITHDGTTLEDILYETLQGKITYAGLSTEAVRPAQTVGRVTGMARLVFLT